jgi:high-affinity iron transporter
MIIIINHLSKPDRHFILPYKYTYLVC